MTWTDVQPTLLSAEGDVLLLLDCCHASLAVRSLHGATVEVLAACALNVRALGVGKQSFTTALLSELRRVARSKTTITVEALFWWLTTDVARLVEMPFRWGTSRIHQRSIVLRPLSAPSGSPEPEASLSAN